MSSGTPTANTDLGETPSEAQKLLQKHNDHHTTIEDVPDEDMKNTGGGNGGGDAPPSWAPAMSAKAAGKQKAQEPRTALDTQSHELFPELGGPKKAAGNVAPIWSAKSGANGKPNGASPANGVSRASTPGSGAATPSARHGPPSMSIPGRNVEHVLLEPQHVISRSQLKRPIPDIIKDVNRRSRANITMIPSTGGRMKFEASGPQDIAQQALKDLVQQIGTKLNIKVPIPQSARAHIIGKQGSTIKSLQEKTGARIQLPKTDDVPYPVDDDDDAMIDVLVEGNALSAAAAREAIMKIAGERTANLSTRMRGVPSEFYAFLADPRHNLMSNLEESGVQVRVPPHQPFSSQPPAATTDGQRHVFSSSANDDHIHLAGDRAAVQAAKGLIEGRVAELHDQLSLLQQEIPKGQQQFIIGDRGVPLDDFFADTGCVIILPTDDEDDLVSIIGPAALVDTGLEKAMDLANNMQLSNYDISRVHRQVPGGAAAHARHVTRYLRQRKEIERLERQYNTHINTPFTSEGALPWEFYSRDGKNAFRAQSELKGIVAGHPPSRMASIPVDPFFHQYLRNDVHPRVQENYGVYLVIPENSEPDAPVLLVYEGPAETDSPYQVPQTQPTQADIQAFQKSIREAQDHILGILRQQEDIKSVAVDVPQKYHEKLKRFIKREQENRPANQPPVRVSSLGTAVTLRGPATAAESLAAKVSAFIEQEKADEKERGFTMSFDFPQKYANHLIGKGGSNIRELREKFDVDIQVQDGQVELKGPKAKAEAAKAHINAWGRQLADETTHILKIDPKFHRELIGAQGSTINRLQTRYKVLIFFPRSAKNAKDDESNADAASEAGKPRRQQGPDEVIIRGPKKGADEARDEVLTLYQYLKDNSFTASISMQQKQLPYLIGQGGAAMEALRQQTGAKIDIPNGRDTPESMVDVQIKGTKAQVAAAKKLLEEKKAVFDDTVVKTLEVDKRYHKALIGTGGSNIRDMVVKAGGSDDRRELSRTIQFPKQESDGGKIKIEGRKSVVDKIVTQIQEFVSQRESLVTEVVDVPTEKHRSLIGRGGEAKRQLESQFGVSIDIPRQGSDQTGVNVTGQPADVEKAKSHILETIKEQHGETVQVPRSLHHVVSNGGQFFRKMRSDYHVTVDHAGQTVPPRPSVPSNTRANNGPLPLITDDADATTGAHSWNVVETSSAGEAGDIPWVLHGSPENIEKAKKALATALEQAKRSTVVGYLVLPDPGAHRHVIGHGGRKIDSIRKQSGCKINVPHGKSSDEAIEIMGTKEGVEKAKDLILTAVQEGAKGRE